MFIFYILWSFVYALFSYALTDPNLVLTQASWYVAFQSYMWQTLYENPVVLSISFTVLVCSGFLLYSKLLMSTYTDSSKSIWTRVEECALHATASFSLRSIFSGEYRRMMLWFGILILPLVFSYNALSHDVFNYMFNAKMVVEYQANPHEQVALDFSDDLWVRFMHNTHTPAPYGYGWTAVSTLPYILGFGRFITTWLGFRFFSLCSVVLLYISLQYFSVEMRKKYLTKSELFIVFANPLFLIEVLSNSHNDLWMMAAAISSFALLFSVVRQKYVPSSKLALSAALMLFSISIKFATLVLIIPWLLLVGIHALKLFSLEKIAAKVQYPFVLSLLNGGSNIVLEKMFLSIPLLSSVLLFLPLLTNRSQQFHPWYLLWAFVWLPFIHTKIWRVVLLSLSLTSLLRYIPWMWAGGFDGTVLTHQKLITWGGLAVILVLYYAFVHRKRPFWWE